MNYCALIVTYNRLEKLQVCLDASRRAGFDSIIVVDNCSSDGSRDWLKTVAASDLTVLTTHTNIGGAGGFHYGLSYALEHLDFDWLFIYDDDAYPESNLLKRFSCLEKDPAYQAYCAKVIDLAGNRCTMNIPFTRYPTSFSENIRYALSPRRFIAGEEQPCDIVSLSFVGAALSPMFIKANLQHLFAELFIYFDDVYFSYGAASASVKMRYEPSLVFIHDVAPVVSSSGHEWKIYYRARNLIAGFRLFNANPPFGRFAVTLRILKYALLLTGQKRKMIYLRHLARGIVHGLQGKTGKLNL